MNWFLFWDIDGTLLSTGRAGVFALEQAARDVVGTEIDLAKMQTAGLTDGQIAEAIVSEAGREPTPGMVADFLLAYERHLPERLHWRQGAVLPGVREILETLAERGDVVSLLLTGNTRAGAEAKLRHYGLYDLVSEGAFCVGPGAREEIAARAMELAVERAGGEVDRDRVYVIGDTPHDIRCGKAIGARTIAVGGTHDIEELRAHSPWLVLERLPAPGGFLAQLGIPARP